MARSIEISATECRLANTILEQVVEEVNPAFKGLVDNIQTYRVTDLHEEYDLGDKG